MEALSDPSSNLTYVALTKQSVPDAERLFSLDMVSFMKKKGYQYEEKLLVLYAIGAVHMMSKAQRRHYNYEFLTFILEELMPWYRRYPDFSLLEVNLYAILIKVEIQ